MPDTDTAPRVTRARLRYVRTSPPKARVVLELIRGQDVDTARETLRFCERAAAHDIAKLLDSAIANAEHNDNIPEDELFVMGARADEGPSLKRWRPRARGRGVRVHKRTSHITIELARIAEEDREARRKAEAAVGRARRTIRRRPRAEPEDLDVEAPAEDETDAPVVDEEEAPEEAPVKKAPAKKAPAKTAGTKKAPAKTTAKQATPTKAKKKTTAKKTTAKKQADAPKKAAPRKRSKPKDED